MPMFTLAPLLGLALLTPFSAPQSGSSAPEPSIVLAPARRDPAPVATPSPSSPPPSTTLAPAPAPEPASDSEPPEPQEPAGADTNEPSGEFEALTSDPEPSDPEPSDPEPATSSAEPFETQPPAPQSHRPRTAHSRPKRRPRRRQEPVWGQRWITGSVLAGFNRFGLGVGFTRFVVPRLGFGLEVDDQIIWDHHGAYNLFRLTPRALLMLLPYNRFTPIARGGFGGSIYSRGLGAYGRWIAGAGLMAALGERWSLGLGLDYEGLLPQERFYRNFDCLGDGPQTCHRSFSPWFSLGIRA